MALFGVNFLFLLIRKGRLFCWEKKDSKNLLGEKALKLLRQGCLLAQHLHTAPHIQLLEKMHFSRNNEIILGKLWCTGAASFWGTDPALLRGSSTKPSNIFRCYSLAVTFLPSLLDALPDRACNSTTPQQYV